MDNSKNTMSFFKLRDLTVKEPITDFAVRKGLKLEKIAQQGEFDYQIKNQPEVKINSRNNTFRDFSMPMNAKDSKGDIANFAVNRGMYSIYREAISEIAKEISNSTPLLDYANDMGYDIGRSSSSEYFLRDNSSIKINAKKNMFYDFGTPVENTQYFGDTLEFIKYTQGLTPEQSYEQLMEYRLGADSSKRTKQFKRLEKEKTPFKFNSQILKSRTAEPSRNNVLNYLTKVRGIDSEIAKKFTSTRVGDPDNNVRLVDQTRDDKMIFNWQEPFGNNKSTILGGTTQETKPNEDGKYNKRILSNSSSEYGFNFFMGKDKNIQPRGIIFCESAIDCMSVYEILNKADKIFPKLPQQTKNRHMKSSTDYYHFQSTEGVKYSIFEKTIKDYMNTYNRKPERVVLSFDNDKDGIRMAKKCYNSDIIKDNDIDVRIGIPKKNDSMEKKVDWNDTLKVKKQEVGLIKSPKISNEINVNPTRNVSM